MSDIRQIIFGGALDVNHCDSSATQYNILGGAPDLSKSNNTITLAHNAGLLPNLNLTLNLQTSPRTIVNIKWTFTNDTNLKMPY